jgi:hypothetical protein
MLDTPTFGRSDLGRSSYRPVPRGMSLQRSHLGLITRASSLYAKIGNASIIIGIQTKNDAVPANKTAPGPSPMRRPLMRTVKYTTKGIDQNEKKMVRSSTIHCTKSGGTRSAVYTVVVMSRISRALVRGNKSCSGRMGCLMVFHGYVKFRSALSSSFSCKVYSPRMRRYARNQRGFLQSNFPDYGKTQMPS